MSGPVPGAGKRLRSHSDWLNDAELVYKQKMSIQLTKDIPFGDFVTTRSSA